MDFYHSSDSQRISDWDNPLSIEEKQRIEKELAPIILNYLNYPASGADRLEPKYAGMRVSPMERARPSKSIALANFVADTVFRMTVISGDTQLPSNQYAQENKFNNRRSVEFKIKPWGSEDVVRPDAVVFAQTCGSNYITEIPTMEFAIIGASEAGITDERHKGVIMQYADLLIQPLRIQELTEEDRRIMHTHEFQMLVDSGEVVCTDRGRFFRREIGGNVVVPAVISLEAMLPWQHEFEELFSENT